MQVFLKEVLPAGKIEDIDICHFFWRICEQEEYRERVVMKFFECIEECLAEEGIYIKCSYEEVRE